MSVSLFVCLIYSVLPFKLFYLHFHQHLNLCRYQDPQIQVDENYTYLFDFRLNIANLDI